MANSADHTLHLERTDLASLTHVAASLAPHLVPGHCLLLSGAIGTGKTAFARALIHRRLCAADREEDIPSPTFTLVQSYCDGKAEILHADLYRIEAPSELPALGLDEAFEDTICIIEWPERLGDLRPQHALEVAFVISDHGAEFRDLTFTAHCPTLSPLLPVLHRAALENPRT